MADVGRYVVISTDPNDLTIYNTVLWDGETPYDPGPGLTLMLEEDALLAGYVYPTPPDDPAADIVANLNIWLGANDLYLETADADQVAALTRQLNGLIRLATGQLDDISDT